jgi:hypothetical protein
MRVVVPPVLVGDRICRIVSALESLLEVEEWVGAWWAPSDVPLTLVSSAAPASDALLQLRGVPESDRMGITDRPLPSDFEALMRSRDPERPAGMRFDEEPVVRVQPARKPEYPGNARFRKNAGGGGAPVAKSRRGADRGPQSGDA